MSWDCQSAEYTMKLNNSDLPQEKRRSQEIKVVCPLSDKQFYFFNCLPKREHTKFIEFCDFVLRNFDHRNFGLLFPKFLFYWAKWSV